MVEAEKLVKVTQLEKKEQFINWHKDIMMWLIAQDVRFDRLFNEIQDEKDDIAMTDADLMLNSAGFAKAEDANKEFYNVLRALTTGGARNLVEKTPNNGCEAWRKLLDEFDPKTTFNRQAIYDKLIDPKKAMAVEDLTGIMAEWDVL